MSTSGPWRSSRLGPASLATFIISVFAFAGPTRPGADPDSWWHLRTGELILQTGSLPMEDPFSWTAAGRDWVPHEWLSQTIFALASRFVGVPALPALAAVCFGTAILLLGATLRRLGMNPWASAVSLGVAVYLGTITWTIRPHMFSVLLFSLFLYLLVRFRSSRDRRWAWWLVPATVVWANLHGVFVAGLVLIWIFAVVDKVVDRGRDLVPVAIAATVAGALNPNWFAAYVYPFHVANVSRQIDEWASPALHDPYGAVLIFSLLALPVLTLFLVKKPDVNYLSLGIVFGLMGMAAVKNGWLAGFALAPGLALALSHLRWPSPSPSGPIERLALGTVAVLALSTGAIYAGYNVLGRSDAEILVESHFPSEVVSSLNELPPGNVLNPYEWGGYLIWAAPRFRVSIDGRNDMYGEELLTEDFQLEDLWGRWRELLERPQIDYVLWDRDLPLSQVLPLLDGWSLLHEDEEAVLYQRRP